MRFNKVLLIQPKYSSSHYGAYRPPAGLGYLAETLKMNNIDYDIIDMDLGYDYSVLKAKINSYEPDLIGVTMLSLDFLKTYTMLKRTKTDFHNIPIIVGGAHISVMREEALEQCNAIDYGVVMEGEFTLLELCQGKSLEEIKGLLYRRNSNILFSGERPFYMNIASIPWPKYDKFDLEKYILREVTIISSRGCPYNCTYCPVRLAIGRKMRFRNAANIVDEIEYWLKKGYRFYIGDDNFTASKKRVYEICDEMEKRDLARMGDLQCLNGVRADRIDRDLLKRMREIGFTALAFGVEGGNDKMLNLIKKGESLAVIENAIKISCELGFDVTLFFIVGVPGETWNDFQDAVNLALKYPIADVRFYNLIPFPKTEVYDIVAKNNYFIHSKETYLDEIFAWGTEPVFATPEFPAEERRKALKIGHEINLEVRKRFAQRRLAKFGPLSLPIAWLFVQPIIQNLLYKYGPLRRVIENVYRKIIRTKK